MTRRKVQLSWILNPSSRRATFKKRRECLMRKVMEISTLTGEDACGIVLSPEEGEPPVFWPPSITEVLDRFFSLPETDQCKKMTTLEMFMQEKICKMEEKLEKERRKARDEEINLVMHSIYSHGKQIDSLTYGETYELFWYMEELRKKFELRNLQLNQDNASPDSFVLRPTPPPLPFQSARPQQPMPMSGMFINNLSRQPFAEHNNSTDGEMNNRENNKCSGSMA